VTALQHHSADHRSDLQTEIMEAITDSLKNGKVKK